MFQEDEFTAADYYNIDREEFDRMMNIAGYLLENGMGMEETIYSHGTSSASATLDKILLDVTDEIVDEAVKKVRSLGLVYDNPDRRYIGYIIEDGITRPIVLDYGNIFFPTDV